MTEAPEALARIQEASFARAAEATLRAFPEERRMDARMLESFLRRKGYGVLATSRPDGRPHAAPIAFSLVGARFVIGSLSDAARVHNLRASPHASLVVTEAEGDAHAAVIVEGAARLVEPLEASLEMREPFREPSGTLPEWIGVFVVLTPQRILSYAAEDFGADSP